jgi:hypothetical protein
MVFGNEEGAMTGSVQFGGSRSEKILSHYSIGSENWYKVEGEILMSKLTGRMRVNSRTVNLGTNGALATCPRKGRAQLDRF